ncbi:MAG: PAS domain S-box protein [Geobacter sp.]|nr:PAS domain S-box protein [Geobacter sp.]
MENLESYLLQIVEASPDAILIADLEGIILYWNIGAERLLGFTATEAVGKPLDIIIPENLRARHNEGYDQVMASGETKYKTGLLSAPALRKDGSRVSLEFSIVLLRDAGGAMAGCASIMRDVSERWQKEKELKERLADCEARLADTGRQP